MGWLDRLWHNPSNDEDSDENDEHECSQHYTIIDRGDSEVVESWVNSEGLNAICSEQIVLECTVCGETTDGYDHRDQEAKMIPWQNAAEVIESNREGIAIKSDGFIETEIPPEQLVDEP